MTTIITMHMVTIGTRWNCGMPKWNGRTMSTQARGADLGEVHQAQGRRQDGAGDDAEQHRDVGDEAPAPLDQRQDDQQHEQGDAKAGDLPVIGIGEGGRDAVNHLGQGRQPAAGPVDADAHQGDADHQDDGAGHDRRKKRQ